MCLFIQKGLPVMASKSNSTVTIKDVAQMCGVSISTVSNVLNGKTKKVSAEVYNKVYEAVEKTGYKPNYLAKNLRASSTKTIGVIAEDLIVFSTASMIEGVMNACEERGYDVVIENLRLFGRWGGSWIRNDSLYKTAFIPALKKLDALNVDGIIYIGSHEHVLDDFKSPGNIPIVTVYSHTENHLYPSYSLDDKVGGYDVINYLMSMGHKKIGIITGEADNVHTINRLKGVQQAYFESKLLFDPELVSFQTWSREGGYKGMEQIMKKDISAVFCFSDTIVAGAYAYLTDHNLVPGKDISVIGYDNQDISFLLSPQVTTMALPLEELGYYSVSRLIDICDGNTDINDNDYDVRLKSTLIERESVAKIN